MGMIWIKFRHKSSSGVGDWEFRYYHKREEIKPAMDYEVEQNSYSEHYRGVEWKTINAPPPWVMTGIVNTQKDNITRAKIKIDIMKKEMARLANVKPHYVLARRDRREAQIRWDQSIERKMPLNWLQRKFGMPLEVLAKKINRKIP